MITKFVATDMELNTPLRDSTVFDPELHRFNMKIFYLFSEQKPCHQKKKLNHIIPNS